MSNCDIKPIPDNVLRWSGDRRRLLDRVELREEYQRRLVRAVFTYTDSEGETTRTLSRDTSTNQYYLEKQLSNRDAIIRVLSLWEVMMHPSDFTLMKEQLGVSEATRDAVDQSIAGHK
ncbi:hypothetical protein KJ657_04650 [Patescibacteria group bacterium]|nr:hypothetical protein [Patescibacteria group bacterium]MBU1016344.1 hypothetical protein [Patescibacteria group bacterium]MBU1685047.1 hypothetical protein [Patescibacteria group bacterium]MBU1938855.1 hypothetical protein [Patescibacteria group bacterium]